MRAELGADMINPPDNFQRNQRVQGTRDNPTVAWRGRQGTIYYASWGGYWYVNWDGNQRTSSVHGRYLEPLINHRREW